MQVTIIKEDTSEVGKGILLLDIAPFSLCLEASGEIMIIWRNSTIPAMKSETFATFSDNRPVALTKVYADERMRTRKTTYSKH